MQVKQISLDPQLAQIMQSFATADLRHEVLIGALIETLLELKDKEGKPLISKEALDKKAEEIKKQIIDESKIQKPNPIILPGQGKDS